MFDFGNVSALHDCTQASSLPVTRGRLVLLEGRHPPAAMGPLAEWQLWAINPRYSACHRTGSPQSGDNGFLILSHGPVELVDKRLHQIG